MILCFLAIWGFVKFSPLLLNKIGSYQLVIKKSEQLGIDNAIPIGLVVTELVANAFKYAFPDGQSGRIEVVLRETDACQVELVVGDAGLGLPLDVDLDSIETLGLGLGLVVATVRDQLGGTIEVDRDEGTRFTICFRRAATRLG